MRTRKYYIVVARTTIGGRWEMTFGDYDKNVAEDERDAQADSSDSTDYDKFSVVSCGDTQSAIDAKLKELNKGK